MSHHNDLGQPIGFPVPGWTARPRPPREPKLGRYARIEPIDPARHAADLYAANALDREGRIWTYLPYGPFASLADYRKWLETSCLGEDPQFHAVIDLKTGKATGIASYLRIDPANGVIEVGHISYSPLAQDSPSGTEAMFLMASRAFDDLGYRRYEWKCDALNAPSRKAALRLGYQFEGIFRQAVIYKSRNRDTAWYAMTDKDWPAIRQGFERWLDPSNFNPDGRQVKSLTRFRPDPA